jgi:hypothetical protein
MCTIPGFGDLLQQCNSVTCDPGDPLSRVQIGGPGSRSSEDEQGPGFNDPALLSSGHPVAGLVEFAPGPGMNQVSVKVTNSSCESSITAIYFNVSLDVSSLGPLHTPVTGASTNWSLGFNRAVVGDNNTGFKADGFGRFDAVIYNGNNLSPNGGDPDEILAGDSLTFIIDYVPAGSVDACDFTSDISITPPGSIDNRRNVVGRYQAGPMDGSAYIGPCSPPLLVELAGLSARPSDRSVRVEWETRSEIDNQGFNVIRDEILKRGSRLVNETLIAGRGDAFSGQRYELTDRSAVNGVAYKYYLEDIDFSGLNTIHGPRVAIPNPESPRIRLSSPAYGEEIADGRRLRFGIESSERGRLTLQVSADPTFAGRRLDLAAAGGRSEVVPGMSDFRRIKELSAEADGHLYWRVVRASAAAQDGSDSPTFRFRLVDTEAR